MKLTGIWLRNFRGYASNSLRIDQLTSLVGRNDAGKSTVLEALDIFFETKGAKIEIEDLNRFTLESSIEIGCTFGDIDDELVLDDTVRTTLKDEFLLNGEGELEIVKRWKVATRVQPAEVFARALYPQDEGLSDLLQLKLEELKKRAKELGVEVEDKRKAPVIRAALFAAVPNKRLEVVLVPLNGDGDTKKVWERLQGSLPLYLLFKADRATSDEDSEAQDPMNAAVRLALQGIQDQLHAVRAHVQDHVQKLAERTVEELRRIDSTLAGELSPTFRTEPKWDAMFKLSLTGERSIPLNKRGSGVRRLVLLSYSPKRSGDRSRKRGGR